jgi:molybdate transport system substrate-binding protein
MKNTKQHIRDCGSKVLPKFVTQMPRIPRFWLLLLLGLLVAASCTATGFEGRQAPGRTRGDELLVAAASDLQFAFTEIGQRWEAQTGQRVTFSFGSTGNLTAQIENGAPFDVFAAANVAYIERLREKGLIIPDTQQLYAQGRIVLAVNRASGVQVTRLEDLLGPEVTRVAIANPAHAPYGVAAMQALQRAGVWERVQPKLVYGENVRQALQFVQTGNVPVGIVARSIADVPEVTWTLIDAGLHEPINQAMAVVRGTPHEEAARAFIAFVNGPQGREIMKKYGFRLPGEF